MLLDVLKLISFDWTPFINTWKNSVINPSFVVTQTVEDDGLISIILKESQ